MKLTQKVRKILSWYESDNPGTKGNLARILMEGRLGGTGRMVILPVDQGFEHGPARAFGPNPDAFDPRYHIELAIEAGCLFAIDTDAHAPGQLDFLDYGAQRADAAGIDPDRIVNTWPKERLLAWANS